MKRYRTFWENIKSCIEKKESEDKVRSKRFFQLLKIEQDKTTPVPSPDFYSRVASGLQKIEGGAKDKSPCFFCRRRTLPWALVTAGVIFVIIAVCSLHTPFSPKLGVDEAFFVLTPEVIILESLSETEDSDSNGVLLNHDSKSGAQNSIEWSNKICML
ncbi:MAG: hypothetical protein J7K30_15765 [Deltaproteobacteria bacterium]|nr:hypothetical protein [Deltaproteobacteria bacterium]